MRLKKDGHIQFYTKKEWVEICGDYSMNLVDAFDSEITLPRKKSTSESYKDVLAKYDKEIVESYQIKETEEEIWITEQVNNLMFAKE